MESLQYLPPSKIKPNPANPRIIKDDKWHKLVQSLKDFPDMAQVRPIVVNSDMMILGGNQRFKAMKEAKWKSIPVVVVDWDKDKQREFIIKDNASFGEWQWDQLANEWDAIELDKWGIDLPIFESDEQQAKEKPEAKEYANMIACPLTDDEAELWQNVKEKIGKAKDKNAIFELVKLLDL